jgi:hypothetical protein
VATARRHVSLAERWKRGVRRRNGHALARSRPIELAEAAAFYGVDPTDAASIVPALLDAEPLILGEPTEIFAMMDLLLRERPDPNRRRRDPPGPRLSHRSAQCWRPCTGP